MRAECLIATKLLSLPHSRARETELLELTTWLGWRGSKRYKCSLSDEKLQSFLLPTILLILLPPSRWLFH